MENRTFIFGHTSFETAYEIKNYPYGSLRTSMFVWIESEAKKGDRVCRVTINPKNGRVNAAKKSTYSTLYALYINNENGHVESTCIGRYTEKDAAEKFLQDIGGEEKLNEAQRFNVAEILKIGKPVSRELIKGTDFKVKFEKSYSCMVDGVNINEGKYSEGKITFDRPDGISVGEILKAIKSLDQKKVQKVFDGWESSRYGHQKGFFRICVRGGYQLTTIQEQFYKEFLASDHAQ